ncbi:type VI secretion system protein ImpH [Rhodobacter aestuarii]|uniref:Type VI secretion system protein ImpH n=1 Tax=Rhodobacter aestuarii TaxID=453582 RepID=A0A1N7JW19_9RHOB|nr:type VI secretion system baseplate subunit TssG [Rhodobacter aestuarii]PTV95969.1 type VI secretion system protein ImpH [Rhodobacter aestuarii]SIS53436.1 type VI secretion system protein ImpH [Rhodobacter aestuarii]
MSHKRVPVPGPDTPDADEAARDAAGRYGLFALLRFLERSRPDLPRIGRNKQLKDELVDIGQDPYLAFPDNDLSAVSIDARGRWRLRSQVIGLFGPQGALPLSTTEEALRWQAAGEDGFTAFADLLSARFQQLFFRAWSDSHAISQHDRPEEDRFAGFLAALIGFGTPAMSGRDSVPDSARVHVAGLAYGRDRSPVRLRQILERLLGDPIEVIEHCPSWIDIEPEDRNSMGLRGSRLGRDMFLGARIRTVNDRITLSVKVDSLQAYRDYLPGGPSHRRLTDLVFWYLRDRVAVTLRLSLPANAIPPARLGQTAELGWMAALSPTFAPDDDHCVPVAEYLLDFSSPTATETHVAA